MQARGVNGYETDRDPSRPDPEEKPSIGGRLKSRRPVPGALDGFSSRSDTSSSNTFLISSAQLALTTRGWDL